MSDSKFPFSPLPFMLPGVVSLLLALWAGVSRLPFALPGADSLGQLHGPLMVGGFLGTVIAVERAAALGRWWPWLGPVCTGLGTLTMLFSLGIKPGGPDLPVRAGAFLFAWGGLIYAAATYLVFNRQRTLFNLVLTLGGVAFFAGNLLLFGGRPLAEVVPLWGAYLVLTIAGERLELNRLLAPKPIDLMPFHLAVVMMIAGLILYLTTGSEFGMQVWGAGLVMLAGWLLWRDIARKTVKLPGVTRFVAVCLLTGYFWLLIAGILSFLYPGTVAGPQYDAIWHALFLGFVISMIFGHAPIMVPALTGVMVDFRKVFYLPLALLHLTLFLRVIGDLGRMPDLRRWAGLAGAVVVVLFFVILRASLRKLPDLDGS